MTTQDKPVVGKEPVAWRYKDNRNEHCYADDWGDATGEGFVCEPLYTLTADELSRLSDDGQVTAGVVTDEMVEAIKVLAKAFEPIVHEVGELSEFVSDDCVYKIERHPILGLSDFDVGDLRKLTIAFRSFYKTYAALSLPAYLNS